LLIRFTLIIHTCFFNWNYYILSEIFSKRIKRNKNQSEEKPFLKNDELPEAELYFGGDKGETETEHDLRMIRYSQREEIERL
jgi:hypothetical protein